MRNKLPFCSLLGAMAALLSVVPAAQAQNAPTNAQLIDKILAKVKPGQKFVKTDDMILEVAKLRAYRGKIGGGRSTSSAFYQTSLWTGGNVYYVFDASLLPAQRTAFIAAAREWETVARLKFLPRTTQRDYIRVYKDANDGSFSAIGRVGGVQDMSLAGWAEKYTAAHEIAHALGVMHEQSRSDRDTFVSIDFTNITEDKQNNFTIVNNSMNHGPYDFESVMHYPQYAFGTDPNKPTIITKAGYTQFQNKMGQRNRLSASDKKGMAEVYGAPLSTLAPANDKFANAQVISGLSGSVTGTNNLATKETGEEEATGNKANASVWYRWRPTTTGSVTFTTKGSAIDTTLGVYEGSSVSTVTPVAYNDDVVMGANTPAAGLTSSVTFPAQVGATYYIAVDSFNDFLGSAGLTGALTLNWTQRSEAANFRLSGSVKTASIPSTGVAGVTITLTGADASNQSATGTATTNSSGAYTISNLPVGNYNLRASKAGVNFLPSSLRVSLMGNSTGNNFTATEVPLGNQPEMYISNVEMREGNTGSPFITFNVSMSAPSLGSVTVNYTTVDANATAGNDYNATKGTLTFAPGATTATVSVRLRPDTTVEGDEDFLLVLSGAAGARIVNDTGFATIFNDDATSDFKASDAPAGNAAPQSEKTVDPSARTSKIVTPTRLARLASTRN